MHIESIQSQLSYLLMNGSRQEILMNVLKAYAVYHPEVGYCQGMGFVTALLLMYMEEEVRYLHTFQSNSHISSLGWFLDAGTIREFI